MLFSTGEKEGDSGEALQYTLVPFTTPWPLIDFQRPWHSWKPDAISPSVAMQGSLGGGGNSPVCISRNLIVVSGGSKPNHLQRQMKLQVVICCRTMCLKNLAVSASVFLPLILREAVESSLGWLSLACCFYLRLSDSQDPNNVNALT